MLFIHIIFGLLATIALLSTRNNFGDTRLFITFTLIGFATSWWQQKKAQSIPYFKIIINVLLVALTIKALLPFLINKPTDILSGLIKTWIYFIILCTFAIHSKRDYYLIQVLSLGLVVFSCFSQTTPGIIRLSYILAFFIIWVIALRCISLLKDINEIKQNAHYKKWIYQEFKIGIIFIITMFILTVPLYVIMPRVNIPFSPLYRFVEQKNILTYTDFIGKGLYSFFGRSGKKLSLSETKSKKAKVDGINKELRTGMGFMDYKKNQTKPVFWHSAEGYQNMLQELEDRIDQTLSEMDKIDKELKETSQKEEMSRVKELIEESKRLTSRKKGLKKNIEQLQRSQDLLREGYLEAVQEQSMASINNPEDKILLISLKEKTQSFEKDLENKIKSLKNLKEELNRINRGLDEIRQSVYRQSMKSAAGVQIQNAWVKKELLEKKLESLKEKLEELKKQYTKEMSELAASAEAIDLAKTVDSEEEWQAEEETIPLLDLLIRIAVVLILLILTFLLYWIIAFFTPYLREKSKFKGASLKGEFNLAIILLYNFLSRVLNLFGYKYPVVIDPEEHLITIGRRFENLQNDSFRITNLFLEARYSTHKMIREQVEKALNSYGNILTELKSTGSFWQKLILKLNFVFKI